MNTKLITTAVFAALFSASPMVHAQSLVGGATGTVRGAVGVGPGGLAGQDPIGRLGARDTVNGVQREVRGSLAERRAELRELRRQQRAERAAAEAAAEAAAAARANDEHDARLLAGAGSMLGASNDQAQGTGSLAGAATGQAQDDGASLAGTLDGALSLERQAMPPADGGQPDDGEAGDEASEVAEPDAPRARARGEADANADASASRRGASAGASASARGEAEVER
ncbi:hypothetical protein GCM10011521_22800 [Arenimonas soli]|uniref:Uncharacterized protein n=1 Tax=Arenimonas soli TaxID=2269504 RepID=A0ABQ1HN11_9GAMM|nr:hypothetical protein [Arenimonas soli]GGA83832.1 hypothetical protein GCM10011521_22800 [Arenimonas soli]